MTRGSLINARVYLIRSSIAAVVLIIALYALFEFRHLITGPVIAIEYPLSGALVTEPLIELRGHTKNVAHLKLNDRQIYVDSEGNLREPLLLSAGENIIRLEAKDRFGNSVEQILEVLVRTEENPHPTALKYTNSPL